jgi:hypothetical protein
LPNLALLYGAMLAGVDYFLMGARGIAREISGALDALAIHQQARLRRSREAPHATDPTR